MQNFDARIGQRQVLFSGSVVHNEGDGPLTIQMLGGELEFEFRKGEPQNVSWVPAGNSRLKVTLTGFENPLGTSFILPEFVSNGGRKVSARFYISALVGQAATTRVVSFSVF
jgi:hypothetical protein